MRGSLDGSTSGNITVCVRSRPLNAAERQRGDLVCVSMPSKQATVIAHPKSGDSKTFVLDRAFSSFDEKKDDYASQQTIMCEIGQPLMHSALEGFNTCLFAYGQTGSGKTFSMMGRTASKEHRGLLPRMTEEVFALLSKEKDEFGQAVRFWANVQFVEIYNEQLRDLLATPEEEEGGDEGKAQKQRRKLEVRTDPKVGVHVYGARDVPVFSAREVDDWLDFGLKARSVGATNMNAESSRSHCVFTLEIQRSKKNADGRFVQIRSKVNLVDLAGSERSSRSGATGDRLKEGCSINQSLTTLAIVISKLAKRSSSLEGVSGPPCAAPAPAVAGQQPSQHPVADHIPFRSSKLTYLLSNSLSGNSKTVMLAAVSPSAADYEETLSTLRFAESAKKVQLKAKKNEECTGSLVKELQAEVERLRAQIQQTSSSWDASALTTELEATEALAAKYGQDIEERLEYARRCEEQRTRVLEDAGLTLRGMCDGLGLAEGTPKLVSVSFDPALSGCLLYFLRQGRPLAVGSDKGCHIQLNGLGMKPLMAEVQNLDNVQVTLSRVAGRVVLNTRQLTEAKAIALRHNDRVTFGHAFCFRVDIPSATSATASAAAGIFVPEEAPADGGGAARDHLQETLQEVVADTDSDYYGSCLNYVRLLGGRLGEARARGFLRKFQHLLPVVEEANELAGELRPQDRFEFTLEAVEELSTHQTEVPECVVRLKKYLTGKQRLRSIIRRKVLHQKALGRLAERLIHRRHSMVLSEDSEPAKTVRLLTEVEFRERVRRLREQYNSNDAATGAAWHESAAARSRAVSSYDPFCVAEPDELLITGQLSGEAVSMASKAARARAASAASSSATLAAQSRVVSRTSTVSEAADDELLRVFGAFGAGDSESGGEGGDGAGAGGEGAWRRLRREQAELEVSRSYVLERLEELEQREVEVKRREVSLRRRELEEGAIGGAAMASSTLAPSLAPGLSGAGGEALRGRPAQPHFPACLQRFEARTSAQLRACRGLLDEVGRDLASLGRLPDPSGAAGAEPRTGGGALGAALGAADGSVGLAR